MPIDTAVFTTLGLTGLGALVWLACSSFSAMKQSKDNLLWCLPFLEPQPDGRVIDAIVCGQLSQRYAPAEMCNVMTLARVVALGVAGRPSAVTGLIVAVYIDTIKRVAHWARPHISQEDREIMDPFGAHGDTAPAVVPEVRIVSREASRFRLLPCLVLRHLDSIARGAVCGPSAPGALDGAAAATCGLLRPQVLHRYFATVSTITETTPVSHSAALGCQPLHKPTPVSVSLNVKLCRHIELIIPRAVPA